MEMNFRDRKKVFLLIGGLVLAIIVILVISLKIRNNRLHNLATENNLEDIVNEQKSTSQQQGIINQVTNPLSGDINTNDLKSFLKDQGISSYDSCFLNGDSGGVKNCIARKEESVVESLGDYTLQDCKKLVFYKDRCLNTLYYKKAKHLQNDKICDYINNSTQKDMCKKNVQQSMSIDSKLQELTKNQEQRVATNLATISQATDVNSCNSLQGDFKLKCVVKFATLQNDLRLCKTYLQGTAVNACVYSNWSRVVAANLSKAQSTKDKSYCEKIYIPDWKKKCLEGIK